MPHVCHTKSRTGYECYVTVCIRYTASGVVMQSLCMDLRYVLLCIHVKRNTASYFYIFLTFMGSNILRSVYSSISL